jgi:hypothetical protein
MGNGAVPRSVRVTSARVIAAAACLVAVGAAVVAARYGVFVAAGSDAYGYVSQSELWATGTLRIPQPIARELPAALTDDTLAPLGYRPARRIGLIGDIVPTYPPGLPMLMAVARLAFGPDAVYYVVPLLAGLAAWCTFVLGRRFAGSAAGLAAAILMVTSPAFAASSIRPMSDVPAAAWWALSLVLAARAGAWSAAGAGAAAAMAVLTRPNLAPVGAVIGLWFLVYAARARRFASPEFRRLLAFSAAAISGPLLVAVIQQHLYKSPFMSGYGAIGDIYAWQNVGINLERYPRWLLETKTAYVLAAVAGPFVCALWARDTDEGSGHPNMPAGWSSVSQAWMALAVCCAVFAAYLPYIPFLEWSYLRFLVPAFPSAFALAAAALAIPLARLSSGLAALALAGAVAVIVPLQVGDSVGRSVFRQWEGADRDVRIGRYLDSRLSPRAVLFSMQMSGSARFYGHRLTVRYDFLPPGQLEPVVQELTASGFEPYLLLEDWEEAKFRNQFAAVSRIGELDWPPCAETATGSMVRLYNLRDREKTARGERVETEAIR